jgi:hypothetical protein
VRIQTRFQTLIAIATTALVAGCSSGSAIAPTLGPTNADARSVIHSAERHVNGFFTCPSTSQIEYVSDPHGIINIYSGEFASQEPCGQITTGLSGPWGLYVDPKSHDLYVANNGAGNILVFHRGQTKAYNTYTDPSVQHTLNVVVAKDGTVIASNSAAFRGPELGSISTWIVGPNGGKFVGNFPMTNAYIGYYIVANQSGTIYYNDIEKFIGGTLWSLSCPAGACGNQTQVSGVSFQSPGGMAFDDTGDLVAVNEGANFLGNSVETFELPNPNPTTFPLPDGSWPMGMAIDKINHHIFVADANFDYAAEYSYPSGALIGTVVGNPKGQVLGIAVDPFDTAGTP